MPLDLKCAEVGSAKIGVVAAGLCPWEQSNFPNRRVQLLSVARNGNTVGVTMSIEKHGTAPRFHFPAGRRNLGSMRSAETRAVCEFRSRRAAGKMSSGEDAVAMNMPRLRCC